MGEDQSIHLDQSRIFLLARDKVIQKTYSVEALGEYEMDQELVDGLFSPSGHAPGGVAALSGAVALQGNSDNKA